MKGKERRVSKKKGEEVDGRGRVEERTKGNKEGESRDII